MIVTDEQFNEPEDTVEGESAEVDATPPQYGVGPFSIREVALTGVWLVAFVLSFFPLSATVSGAFLDITVTWSSVWLSGLAWLLTIGVPTIAVFLVVLRRLSPQGIRRFGSLGVDQFASVAFSISALIWLGWVWETVAIVIETGVWVRSWVIWVEFVLMVAGVVLTVLAPVIPVLREDFAYRPEIPAHPNARPSRPIVARPAPVRPVAPEQPAEAAAGAEAAGFAGGYVAAQADDPYAPTGEYGLADEQDESHPAQARDTFEPVEEPARHEAFWALVPEERDVVDETGGAIFRIGPTAWALVIEDRGDEFVVRHEDGRLGYLRDVSGVTRG